MNGTLKYSTRGKKGGLTKAKVEQLFKEATEIMGGTFGIQRMERRGSTTFVTLDKGPRGGMSIEQFTQRLTT